MANYEQGIATHIHYLRLSEEDTQLVKQESLRLGISNAELFRRMVDLYFEVKATVPATSTPDLTPRQAESLLKTSTSDAGAADEDRKFDFTTGDDE